MTQIGEGLSIATLLLYLQACNKMAVLGYACTLGKQTSCFHNAARIRMPLVLSL